MQNLFNNEDKANYGTSFCVGDYACILYAMFVELIYGTFIAFLTRLQFKLFAQFAIQTILNY